MAKYSDKIPEEKIEQVIEGTVTPEQVSEETGVPVSAVHNKKNRVVQKKKLEVGFSSKGADQNLPKNDKVRSDTITGDNGIAPMPQINYTESLKGFWSMVDMMLKSASWLTNGQLDYTPLEEKDIQGLAEISSNNETMRKIATFQGADLIMVLGYAGMKFAPRIKLNKYPKHDDKKAKELKCKCEECTKKIEEAKAKIKQKTEEKIKQSMQVQQPEKEQVQQKEVPDNQTALQEFLQRNLGSDPQDLAKADQHIEAMKTLQDRPHIVE